MKVNRKCAASFWSSVQSDITVKYLLCWGKAEQQLFALITRWEKKTTGWFEVCFLRNSMLLTRLIHCESLWLEYPLFLAVFQVAIYSNQTHSKSEYFMVQPSISNGKTIVTFICISLSIFWFNSIYMHNQQMPVTSFTNISVCHRQWRARSHFFFFLFFTIFILSVDSLKPNVSDFTVTCSLDE